MSRSRATQLGALIVVVAAVAFGLRALKPQPVAERAVEEAAARPPEEGLPSHGKWGEVHAPETARNLTPEQRREVERLNALAYVGGSVPASGGAGVTRHQPERAFDGLNLYLSGHDRVATLMTMTGEVLHTWNSPTIDVEGRLPDLVFKGKRAPKPRRDFLSVAHLYANGDLLVVLGNTGMLKLSKHSRVLWQRLNFGHHDLDVDDDGTIYALTRDARVEPKIHPSKPVLLDYVSMLDANGKELRRVSIYDAFVGTPHAAILDSMPEAGDLMHTNTVELLDGRLADRLPQFADGNVLLSMRTISVIAVLDMRTEKIVWAMGDLWKHQHRPTVLDNDRLLIFDNEGGDPSLGKSRVFEFDPTNGEIAWSYEGSVADPLDSNINGTCQRLPNGNTLIVESYRGRALEVTPDGNVVWEFRNPHRFGNDDELIAMLLDVVRLPADFPLDWRE